MSAALCIGREQTARIARLNDQARQAMGVVCTAVATVGFRSLPDADQSSVRELIATFDAFDDENDPHGERDFGTIYQLVCGRWTTERPRLREDEHERVFVETRLLRPSDGVRQRRRGEPSDYAARPDHHAVR